MITHVAINNFKAHRATELGLAPFTVLVGSNGVGKTSVLEALHLLAQCTTKPAVELLRGPWRPELARRTDADVVLSETFRRADGDENQLSLSIHVGSDGFTSLGVVGPGGSTFSERQCARDVARNHPLLAEAGSAVMLRLSARAIAAVGYIDSGGARVEFDGGNTAAVIAQWKLQDDERLARVEHDLRKVVPHLCGLRAKAVVNPDPPFRGREGEGAPTGFALLVDFDDARDVPANLVSEGTLVAVALLVLLHQARRARLVLIDDLGAELHPTGQGDLVALLLDIQRQNPLLQIVASTHSPYVLDALEPDQVRVFARGADGSARVRSLAEHPSASVEGITTGQLWTMDPEESWVLKGQE